MPADGADRAHNHYRTALACRPFARRERPAVGREFWNICSTADSGSAMDTVMTFAATFDCSVLSHVAAPAAAVLFWFICTTPTKNWRTSAMACACWAESATACAETATVAPNCTPPLN